MSSDIVQRYAGFERVTGGLPRLNEQTASFIEIPRHSAAVPATHSFTTGFSESICLLSLLTAKLPNNPVQPE
jgi:hypothetical protein